MGKIGRSWALTKSCFRILRRDRYLAWFPVLSGLSGLLVLAPLIAGGIALAVHASQSGALNDAWFEQHRTGVKVGGFAALLVLYFIGYFLATFFNVGLISCVLNRLEGKPASLRSGLHTAWSRKGQIAGWALLGATVGVVLQAIEERVGILGKVVTWLVGLAWALVTFLVAPVIAFEGLGPIDALKRSATLFKQTWGEQLAFRVGIGAALSLLFFLFFVLVLGVGIAVPALTGLLASPAALGLWIAALLLLVLTTGVMLSIVSSCLTSIYHAVLYSYAVTGMLPDEFDAGMLPQRA